MLEPYQRGEKEMQNLNIEEPIKDILWAKNEVHCLPYEAIPLCC